MARSVFLSRFPIELINIQVLFCCADPHFFMRSLIDCEQRIFGQEILLTFTKVPEV